jgi:hypothetical protein
MGWMTRLVPGVQIKNRLPGRKPIRSHHSLQMFDVGLIERIEFQINLPKTKSL